MTPALTPQPVGLRGLGGKTAFAALAIAGGSVIALAPLPQALAVGGGGLGLLALILEPLVGLAGMLLLGPTEPLLSAAGLLPFSVGQLTLLLFAGAWLLRGLARRSIRWPALPVTLPFFFYFIACVLSVFFNHLPSPKDSATELIKWGEMYLIAGLVADMAGPGLQDSTGQKKLGWVIVILLGVGAFQAGIGFWQFQFRGHGPEAFKILGDHYRAYGTLEQPNPFGGFMGLVWPIAAAIAVETGTGLWRHGRRQWRGARSQVAKESLTASALNPNNQRSSFFNQRYLRLALAGLVAAATFGALVISFSRGAWLGAAAAGLGMLIFWPHRRWLGWLLAGGGLAAILALYYFGWLPAFIASRFADVGDFVQVYDVRGVHINDSNFSIVERLAHWQAALNMADARPLFGVGFGNYEVAYETYRLINWRYALGHAHMVYLNVLAETGAVGLAAYGLLWGSVVLLTLRVIRRAEGLERAVALGLLGAWIHLATHQLLDNLYVGNVPLYLGALWGVLCSLAQGPPPGEASGR